MSVLTVGDKLGPKRNFNYTDLPGNHFEDWYEPSSYLPLPFDLAEVQTQDRVKIAWWTGSEWFGTRLGKGDKISKWKRTSHLNII